MGDVTTPELRGCAAAVVVAAGSGRRMGGGNKALLPLGDGPLLARSVRALRAAPAVAQVVVVMNDDDRAAFVEQWGCDPTELGADLVVPGGEQRWLSSRNGVTATDPALELVTVHDAARPLVSTADHQAVLEAAARDGCALLAVPLDDTLKEADEVGAVARTLPRERLWRAATPQAARRALLLAAFDAWPTDAPPPTDECRLLEAAGHHPTLVEARGVPLKITRARDHELLEKLLCCTTDDA